MPLNPAKRTLIPEGAGSYLATVAPPSGGKRAIDPTLPTARTRQHGLPTNEWFTPLLYQDIVGRDRRADMFTQRMYADPFMFRATKYGMLVAGYEKTSPLPSLYFKRAPALASPGYMALYQYQLVPSGAGTALQTSYSYVDSKDETRNVALPLEPGKPIPNDAYLGAGGFMGNSAQREPVGQMYIGHSAISPRYDPSGSATGRYFTGVQLDGYSDWAAGARFSAHDADVSLSVTMAPSSPFVFAEIRGGEGSVFFSRNAAIDVRIWDSTPLSGPVLGITVIYGDPKAPNAVAHYGIFGATGSSWRCARDASNDPNEPLAVLTNTGGKGYFSVAVLPDADPATLARFKDHAYSKIIDTRITPSYDPASAHTVQVRFDVTTRLYPGETGKAGTLFAWMPHHYLNQNLTFLEGASGQEWTYDSLRGPMRVGEGSFWLNTLPIPPLLWFPPDFGGADPAKMIDYLGRAGVNDNPSALDTYAQGKYMAKRAVLAPIADAVADSATDPALQKKARDAASALRDEVQKSLETWFTASTQGSDGNEPKGSGDKVFWYDSKWGSLIGYPASYGSEIEFNDHHYHYGYFVRAAAELARTDPQWAKNWGPMVNLVIRDYASPFRDDSMFPFLRGFSPIYGQSWANGTGKLADGMNTESMSEAINADGALILWALANPGAPLCQALLPWALYLYASDVNAANLYYYDIGGELRRKAHPEYPAALISNLFSGKFEFSTWFPDVLGGRAPILKHGIQLLPMTAGSYYQALSPSYVDFNLDGLQAENREAEAGQAMPQWHDLLVMYQALSPKYRDAARQFITPGGDGVSPLDRLSDAFVLKGGRGSLDFEAGNTKAMTYWWITSILGGGVPDMSYESDDLLSAVFVDPRGKRCFVIHNMSDAARTVRFTSETDTRALTATKRGLNLFHD
jgi:endoglucanase Acf2